MQERSVSPYHELFELIQKRQAFEKENPYEPYISYPTNLNFPNIEGWCLLQLAAKEGDMDKVRYLLENGYNISDTQPFENATALKVAMQHRHFHLAEYLIEKGAKISECDRHEIKDHHCLALYDKKAKELLASVEEDEYQERLPNRKDKTYLDLITELGDLEKLKIYSEPMLVHTAVLNKQYEVLRFLLHEHEEPDIRMNYKTPLHVAMENGDLIAAQILLENEADINAREQMGRTPLYVALMNGHKECAAELMKRGADLDYRTYLDETFFHAMAISGIDDQFTLENNPRLSGLASSPNIYGHTPEDYRLRKFSAKPSILIVTNIDYYLRFNYRDMSLTSDGYCNASVFLYHYYDSIGKLSEFFQLRETIKSWDGSARQLEREAEKPLSSEYNREKDVFEYFISTHLWFQHNDDLSRALKTNIEQHEYQRQLAVVHQTKSIDYKMLKTQFTVNDEQFVELLSIMSKLPPGTRLHLGGGEHGTALTVRDDGMFTYFDTNFRYYNDNPRDVSELASIIANTKYKANDKIHHNKFEVIFYAFQFAWEKQEKNENYFQEKDLPSSIEDAKRFIKRSPNRLSHLHIAIMTNSVENVRKILQDGFIDIRQADAHKHPAYIMAVNSANMEIIDAFLASPQMTKRVVREMIETALSTDDLEFAKNLIYHPQVERILGGKISRSTLYSATTKVTDEFKGKLVLECVKQDNIELLIQLLKDNKIDPKACFDFLFNAMEMFNDNQVRFALYEYCKNVTDDDGNTMLHHALKNGVTQLFPFLTHSMPKMAEKFINLTDAEGNTALHLALAYGGYEIKPVRKLITSLIQSGADISIKNNDGISCADLVEKHRDEKIRNLLNVVPKIEKNI